MNREKEDTTKLRNSINAEKAERTQQREEMMERLRKRDLEYKRHCGDKVTIVQRGGITVETRGRPPIGCAGKVWRLG